MNHDPETDASDESKESKGEKLKPPHYNLHHVDQSVPSSDTGSIRSTDFADINIHKDTDFKAEKVALGAPQYQFDQDDSSLIEDEDGPSNRLRDQIQKNANPSE